MFHSPIAFSLTKYSISGSLWFSFNSKKINLENYKNIVSYLKSDICSGGNNKLIVN